MSKAVINQSNLEFLKQIKKNNNREWFAANKEKYLIELKNIEFFADALLAEMNKHDVIETASGKKSLHRIYRDTRFSKEKTPYKTNWSGSFVRATKLRRGGYYFHLEPNNSFAACGFWNPNPEDLKRIRNEFSFDASPFRKVLKNKIFIQNFGKMIGEQIKTTPKGFNADDPSIDLLRYKQFLVIKKFSDKEILEIRFLKTLNTSFKLMRPFLDYMSDVLTTDENGISKI
jgi:uncharacterized protein (TIGR02453 family)